VAAIHASLVQPSHASAPKRTSRMSLTNPSSRCLSALPAYRSSTAVTGASDAATRSITPSASVTHVHSVWDSALVGLPSAAPAAGAAAAGGGGGGLSVADSPAAAAAAAAAAATAAVSTPPAAPALLPPLPSSPCRPGCAPTTNSAPLPQNAPFARFNQPHTAADAGCSCQPPLARRLAA